MSETTANAQCTKREYELARKFGLFVVTVHDEDAIHKFAEAIRADEHANMDRRAEFAGLALQGILANATLHKVIDELTLQHGMSILEGTAIEAVRYADALVAELAKGGAA